MTSIYYAMLVLPLILMVIFAFVFQDTLAGTQSTIDRITCPMPEISGLWNNTITGDLVHANATYNYPAVNNNTLTLSCTEVHTADGIDYFYGASFVTPAVVGWAYFIGDWLSELFANKLTGVFTLIALFYILPSEVTGLSWFIYAQFFLTLLPALATFMILRGHN